MIDATGQTYRLSRVGNFKFSRAPQDLNGPPPPTLVSAVQTDISMSLVWINGVDAETLTIAARVRFSLQGQNSWSAWQTIPAPGNSLTIGSLVASQGYDFEIVNDDVAGNTSAPLSFTRTTSAAPQTLSPGLIALPLSSISVQEGKQFTFAITQTGAGSASPVVDVQWQITGLIEGVPVPQSGSVQFQPGQNGSQLVTLTAGLVTADRSGIISIINATSETGTVNPSVGNTQCSLSIINVPTGKRYATGYFGATQNFTWLDDRHLTNQGIEENLIIAAGPNVSGYKMWYYTAVFGDSPYDFTSVYRDLNKMRAAGKYFKIGLVPVLYGAGGYQDILPPSIYNDSTMGASPVAGKYGWWTINGGTGKMTAFWRKNVMDWHIAQTIALLNSTNPTTGLTVDADPFVVDISFSETSLSVDAGSDFTTAALEAQYERFVTALAGFNVLFMVNNNFSNVALAQKLSDFCYANQAAGGGPDTYAIGQHGTGTYGSFTGGQLAYLGAAASNSNYPGPDLRGKMAMKSDTQGPEISNPARYTMYTPHSFKTVVDTILEQGDMTVTMVSTSASDKPNPRYPADGVNTGANPGNWSSFLEVFNGAPLSHIQRPTGLQTAAPPALVNTPYHSLLPLAIINIKPANTGSPVLPDTNRIFHAYPGIPYSIRVAAVGGGFDYRYQLNGQPAGMTIDSTGAINWPNPTTNTGPITVTVIDRFGVQVSATWSIIVGTAGFYFIDSSYVGTETGSISQPYSSLANALTGATGHPTSIFYFKNGTYPMQTWNDIAPRMTITNVPWTWLAYPGHAPVIDGGNTYHMRCWSGMYFDGMTFQNVLDYAQVFSADSTAGNYCTVRRSTYRHITSSTSLNNNQGFLSSATGTGQGYGLFISENDFSDWTGAQAVGSIYASNFAVIVDNNFHDGGFAGPHSFVTPIGFKHWNSNNTIRGNNILLPNGSVANCFEVYSAADGDAVGDIFDWSYNTILHENPAGQYIKFFFATHINWFRNTTNLDMNFQPALSPGPNVLSKNVYVDLTILNGTFVTENDNLKTTLAQGAIDSNGHLTAGYLSYLGTHGAQVP